MNNIKLLIIGSVFLLGLSQFLSTSLAASCTEAGQCVNNHICVKHTINIGSPYEEVIIVEGSMPCGSSQIGDVNIPSGISGIPLYNNRAWQSGIGIIPFLSNLVQVFVIVAGIIAMFNFALAGYIFITSGSDPAAVGKVREKLTWTVIGLIFIVASYMAAGLIGLIFFGDAGFILKPTLTSVYDVT